MANAVVSIDGGTFYFQVLSGSGPSLVDAQATLDYTLAVDQYEVTVGQFQHWVGAGMPVPTTDGTPLDPGGKYPMMAWSQSWNAAAQDTNYGNASVCNEPGGKGPTYGKGNPDYPMNCSTWMQALAYCWWDGQKRLPTDTEWRVVATSEGRDTSAYPWGTPSPTCSLAIYDDGSECGFPVKVGTAGAQTLDGVFDIVGSVQEWIWDFVPATGSYVYPASAGTDYAGPDGGNGRQWLGGDYSTAGSALTSYQAGKSSAEPAENFDDMGWRCVKTMP